MSAGSTALAHIHLQLNSKILVITVARSYLEYGPHACAGVVAAAQVRPLHAHGTDHGAETPHQQLAALRWLPSSSAVACSCWWK
jgi:hypothetical protein